MIRHNAIDDEDLRRLILGGHIRYGGNRKLRIYGRLDCASGKRMSRDNRVFFADEAAARAAGFRPAIIAFAPRMRAGGGHSVTRHLETGRKIGHTEPRVVP